MSDSDSSERSPKRKAEKVLRVEKVRKDTKFLVKWVGHHENSATWKGCKKVKFDSERYAMDKYLKNMGMATPESASTDDSTVYVSSQDNGGHSPLEDGEISDNGSRHDGYTDDDEDSPTIPMLRNDRVYSESERILSKLNTDPTIRLTRNRFQEVANIVGSSSRAFTPTERSSRSSSAVKQMKSTPPKRKPSTPPKRKAAAKPKVKNPPPIDPVTGLPIKRGRGRPRKYPLPQPAPAPETPVELKVPKKECVQAVPTPVTDSDSSVEVIKVISPEEAVPKKSKPRKRSVTPTGRSVSSKKKHENVVKPKKEKFDDPMVPCSSKQAYSGKKRRRISSTPSSDYDYGLSVPSMSANLTPLGHHAPFSTAPFNREVSPVPESSATANRQKPFDRSTVFDWQRTPEGSPTHTAIDMSISPEPVPQAEQSFSIESVDSSKDRFVEWNAGQATTNSAYPASYAATQHMNFPPPQDGFLDNIVIQQVASHFPPPNAAFPPTNFGVPPPMVVNYNQSSVNYWFDSHLFNNNEAPKPVPPPNPNHTVFDDLPPPPLVPPPVPPAMPNYPRNAKPFIHPRLPPPREDPFAKIFGKHASPPKHPMDPCPKSPTAETPMDSCLPPPDLPTSSGSESSFSKRSWVSLKADEVDALSAKRSDVRPVSERPWFNGSFKFNIGQTHEARPISLPKQKDKPKLASATVQITRNSKDPRIRRAAEREESERNQAKHTFIESVKNLDVASIRTMDIDKAWLQGVDRQGNTLLHALANCGGGDQAVELLRFLVTKQLVDVDVLNQSGDTPLHVALCCAVDNNSMICALLKLGADANRECNSCERALPLIFAYDRGNTVAAKALLIHGANPYFLRSVERDMPNQVVPNALRAMVFQECWKWDDDQFRDGFPEKTGHLIESSVFVHPLGPSEAFSYDIQLNECDYPVFSRFRVALLEFGELSSGQIMIDRPPYDIFESVTLNNVELHLYEKNASKWVFDASSIFKEMMKYPKMRYDPFNITVKLKGSVVRSEKFMIAALLRYNKAHPQGLIVHSPSAFI
uniref:Chromo domain-containing protein n=1 Tax=Panagrellus redivivus TaxID=6233 RepID=A0A7E4WB95_PANRE